jgi:hypothetical protein
MAGERRVNFNGPSIRDLLPENYDGGQAFLRMFALQNKIDNWFTYHPATPEDAEHYSAIRAAGKALAEAIVAHSPASADQTAAIRKVREAVATANAAVACKGQ